MAKRSYLHRKLAALPADRRAKVDEMAAKVVEANHVIVANWSRSAYSLPSELSAQIPRRFSRSWIG